MAVPEELAPGLWRWTVPHPAWTHDRGGVGGWEKDVNSYALVSPERLVLIDPLVTSADLWAWLDDRARGGVDVLLTMAWHERSAHELKERLGASVWGNAETREGVEDLGIRLVKDGDDLPGGVRAVAPLPNDSDEDETAYWLPEQGAIAVGDVLVGTPEGLRIWWEQTDDEHRARYRKTVRPAVRRLLELPVERVLTTHGDPVLEGGRAALESALAAPTWQRDS
jgi:glyoxylase-like metal-dependent hydrolase (beta-lactamase superfamily II)